MGTAAVYYATLLPLGPFPRSSGYGAYLSSTISRPRRGGLPQLLGTSCAAVLPLTPRWSADACQSDFTSACCLHLKGSASRVLVFRGYLCVHLRYGPAAHSPFYKALSADSRMLVSRYPAAQVTVLPFPLAGLSPAECPSLSWAYKQLQFIDKWKLVP